MIGNEFYKLIHDEKTKELEIDKFIEENPAILKRGWI